MDEWGPRVASSMVWSEVAQGQEELQVPRAFGDYLQHRVLGFCSRQSRENMVLLSPLGAWIWGGSACSVAWGECIQSLTSESASRHVLGSLPAATNGSSLPLPSEVAYSEELSHGLQPRPSTTTTSILCLLKPVASSSTLIALKTTSHPVPPTVLFGPTSASHPTAKLRAGSFNGQALRMPREPVLGESRW